MKPITLLELIVVTVTGAGAQTAAISGRVLDANGNPLSGVTVVYNRIPAFQTDVNGKRAAVPPFVGSLATTDASGGFQIPGLPAGAYHLCTLAAVPGQVSSCVYEPKAVVVPVSAGAQVSGVELTVGAGTVVNVGITDAGGHIRAGSPFAIGAIAVGASWSFFAEFVGQAGQQMTYRMTLPRGYNFGLVVDTSLPVTDSAGAPVVTKAPCMTILTGASPASSASAASASAPPTINAASFVVN
jgi:hypothetical protein